ncbi:MAG TPA: (2Fe-2S)-binding protein [Geminicoccaceae bacterium]|jgi:isoquinoline 1-oxidoreductase subunit alpha|nr:(2Fe-2S)-binding protein [Geminicoccaceae bacterium]
MAPQLQRGVTGPSGRVADAHYVLWKQAIEARGQQPKDGVDMKLQVNGQTHEVEVEPDTPLLWVLRDTLGLTGTKYGCGIAQCGACTVHVDGMAMRSCIARAADCEGSEITTIEGVSGKAANAVQTAWQQLDVPQCGYCQSGQIMTTIALLSEMGKPSDADIDRGLAGNICRCATYHRIRAAVHEAARLMEA